MKREIELAFDIGQEVFFLVRYGEGEGRVTVPVIGKVVAAYKRVTSDATSDLLGNDDLYNVKAVGENFHFNLKGTEVFSNSIQAVRAAQDENGGRLWGSSTDKKTSEG